ncbi:uncharacterized protein BP5553_05351 [Venustampulla echinocandica]|uniref:RlpA-like protein double-psi beta-barrel domain-containing protein n=1 Tax=Venustampulla echinocandica TaxID=2656787 RepID=A0A370TQY7_9HELO|nr:uncharacterized protein BP5553_05351 [Venustampulla echinocandica]RDL37918.1 hypothetical protein BP5553_05351 [Venustampulla echinocandica]
MHTTSIMKSSILTFALLASTAVAQPHRSHKHMAKHAKRADQPVVWVTDIVSETEIVDYTTTIWVSEGYVAPTAAPAPASVEATSSAAPVASAAPSSAAASQVPAQFFEPASPAPVPEPTSTSSSAYVAPTPPAPVETPVATPAVVAPTTSSVAQAPAPSSSSSSGTSTGSPDGQCSEGSPCQGDATFYDTDGIGACGFEGVDGLSESVVALPVGLMGDKSNGNPFCDKMITVKFPNGATTKARVVDKCMGCQGRAIDLSRAGFSALQNQDVGRQAGATWWFN